MTALTPDEMRALAHRIDAADTPFIACGDAESATLRQAADDREAIEALREAAREYVDAAWCGAPAVLRERALARLRALVGEG